MERWVWHLRGVVGCCDVTFIGVLSKEEDRCRRREHMCNEGVEKG